MVDTTYLKAFMKHHKITQQQIADEWAKLVDIPRYQSSVGNELAKERADSIGMIQALANLAKVPVGDIIGGVSFSRERKSIMYQAGENDNVMIPVTNLRGAASSLLGYVNEPHAQTEEFISVPAYFAKPGTNLLMRVTGESMTPTFHADDYIACRLLNEYDWSTHLKDDHVYLILTKDSETILKRIKNRLSDYKLIVCKSDNTDKNEYPDRNVEIEEIDQIWSVQFKLSWKFPDPHSGVNDRFKEIESKFLETDYKLEQLYKEMKTLKG